MVVVDDGIATGASMKAALRALRRRGPARIVLAVPVAPAGTTPARIEPSLSLDGTTAPEALCSQGHLHPEATVVMLSHRNGGSLS